MNMKLIAAAFLLGAGSAAAQGAGAGAATGAAGAQGTPISNVRYDVTFNREGGIRRNVHVDMTFDVRGAGNVLLSLPAWTPGAYEISNFAKWISAFGATSPGSGTAVDTLRWDKLDPDTWRVAAARAGRVKVSFDFLADSLDNAMAWSRSDFLFFNGTNLFMYPEGAALEFAATVGIITDPGWNVATGMQPGTEPRTWTASNYHDLVDMPFFVGRFDMDSSQVDGKWLRFATYPTLSVSGTARERVWEQLRKFVPAQARVFGETPWQTYTVMQIADESFGGASGLEHQNSHVNVITPFAVGHPFMASLYAHEIFHAWNVKRLRPAELWPYRYDVAQPTPLLWISEGITDYYADLTIVRSGIGDSLAFFGLTTEKMNEVEAVPPVALEDASLSTWIRPVDGTATLYYPKGALAGFMLDIMIRDATDNKASLDDVMRQLYQSTYKQGRGFTEQEWWSTVSRVAGGKSFTDFAAKYIDGRAPYPWDQVLPLAGMRMATDSIREPKLGIATTADSSGVRVEEVEQGSAAATAGVRVGDYILAIGEIMLTDPEFMNKFRTKYASGAAAAVPIMVRRGTQTVNLSARAQFQVRVQRMLEIDPAAGDKAKRIRDGLLRGTTG